MKDRPNWVRVAEHAAWVPRDSCGEVVYDDRMWLFGGWLDMYAPGPRDVWCSTDGATWSLVTPEAPWKHGDIPTPLVFDNRMWTMGGWWGGRLESASASNQVWSSRNGSDWTCVTPRAGWCPRVGAAGVVHDGRMWVLGGSANWAAGGPDQLHHDVWCSADGARWDLVCAHAPWAPRAYHRALTFDGKIWLFGGGNYRPDYVGHHDVWCSEDGAAWTEVTGCAPWSPRIWFRAVVHRERMWILGGWSDSPSRNWNDVWHTADGLRWSELKTPTVWSPRHEHSVYVYRGKLWVAGGNEWPLRNDVWCLALPPQWPG
jgi:hypothetical protein